MAFTYQNFDTTPANLVADLKAKILLSSDWSNPSANVVKATTPLGATMAIDLAGSTAPTTQSLSAPYIYRLFSGAAGTDQLAGLALWWKINNTGATTTVPLHVTVVAGNTLLWISIEGPRLGENFADNTNGSTRQTLAISQLTPYFAADTTPQVVAIGSTSYNGYNSGQPVVTSTYVRVGQNMALNSPWATGMLMALTFPEDWQGFQTVLPNKGNDGSFYFSPYVLFEHAAGLRGRLTDLYYAGINRSQNSSDLFVSGHSQGDVLTIGGNTYTVMAPYRGSLSNAWDSIGGFGAYRNNSNNAGNDYTRSPLVAVRTA